MTDSRPPQGPTSQEVEPVPTPPQDDHAASGPATPDRDADLESDPGPSTQPGDDSGAGSGHDAFGWPPPPSADRDDDAAVEPVTTTAEGVTADLWAFRFADPVMAQEALLAAMRLQAHKRLRLDDAAIVTRDQRGRTRITQTRELSTAQAAMSGSWMGLLAGLFVPGGALVGMAVGAAAGGLFAKLRDKGINDDEMKQWGEQLGNGEAALFLLVEDCHQMRVLHEVSRFPATLLTSTGDPEFAAKVTERLAVDPWGP